MDEFKIALNFLITINSYQTGAIVSLTILK